MKPKIVHIITGLEVGGAEVMLCRLLEHADHSRFEHSVICLLERGSLADRLEATGIKPVVCVNMRGLLGFYLEACDWFMKFARRSRIWCRLG